MAQESDAEALLAIYSHYVTNTPITFEYEIPNPDEFIKRIREINSEYPYLVCSADEKIVGYAYAHRYKERAAYQWSAELSVYLDKDSVGLGIGSALYAALIEILKIQNVQSIYGGVTSPNENSEKLHKKMGFVLIGTQHKVGYKNNRWHDVMLFEKHIGNHDPEPSQFQKIECIDKAILDSILENSIRK